MTKIWVSAIGTSPRERTEQDTITLLSTPHPPVVSIGLPNLSSQATAEILATAHHIGFGEPIGAIDFTKPAVDGHGTHYISEVAYFNQQCFQIAMKSIPNRLARALVRVVLIEDRSILYPNPKNGRRLREKNRLRRRLLCEGLDALVKHYMPEFRRVKIKGFSKIKILT